MHLGLAAAMCDSFKIWRRVRPVWRGGGGGDGEAGGVGEG